MELSKDNREARQEPPKAPETVPAEIGRGVPTTCIEHAYGTTVRLSFQIKVF
jgi:hypothetical protein